MISRTSNDRPQRPAPRAGRATRAGGAEPAARPSRSAGAEASARPARQSPNDTVTRGPRPDAAPVGERGGRDPLKGHVPGDKPGAALFLMTELADLLEEENAAITARRYSVLKDTLQRKQSLSRGYLEMMVALKRNPALVKEVPAERADEFRAAGKRLEAAMTENAMLLKANIEAVNRFMTAVVQAVRDHQSEHSAAYEDSGKMDPARTPHPRMAIALNQEL